MSGAADPISSFPRWGEGTLSGLPLAFGRFGVIAFLNDAMLGTWARSATVLNVKGIDHIQVRRGSWGFQGGLETRPYQAIPAGLEVDLLWVCFTAF